jgi:hypothetical protein
MGRGAGDGGGASIGTKLTYTGAAATAAIHVTNGTFDEVSDLSVFTIKGECPANGLLKWNTAAGGTNKWACHDGATFTTPVPHLAGILVGNLNPTIDAGLRHVSVRNVYVDGLNGGDLNQQGSFHFGVWFNGTQLSTLTNVHVAGADDGFYFGASTNGVLGLNLIARLNRRSGIHVRWQNDLTLVAPLMESNQWWAQAVQAPYGRGFLCDAEDVSPTVCRAEIIDGYWEANWLDVSAPTSGAAFRGRITGSFSHVSGFFDSSVLDGDQCVIDAPANVTISGTVQIGCPTIAAGTFVYADNQARLVLTTKYGGLLRSVNKDYGGALGRMDAFEMVLNPTTASYIYLRGGLGEQLRLYNPIAAVSGGGSNSPTLQFRGAKWTGVSTESLANLEQLCTTEAGGQDICGLYLGFGTRLFSLRDNGEMGLGIFDPTAFFHVSRSGADADTQIDSASADRFSRVLLKNTAAGGPQLDIFVAGTTATGVSIFGRAQADASNIVANLDALGLGVGTFGATRLYLGTNNTERVSLDATTPTVFFAALAFASLGTPANGAFVFCNDCTIANPCASGGTGAFAKRLNAVWVCN